MLNSAEREILNAHKYKNIKKEQVSIRGFLWYLNISIILWEQIVIYRGHASLKTLNQMELCFVCIIN